MHISSIMSEDSGVAKLWYTCILEYIKEIRIWNLHTYLFHDACEPGKGLWVATTNRHLGSIFFRIALLTHVSFAKETKKGRKKVNVTGQFREPTNRWHPYFFEGNETLQRIATHCNALQCTATHCNALQRNAMHCNAMQRTSTHCRTIQCTATHCIVPRRTAAHCRTLQHLLPATHCSIQFS